MHFSLCIPLNGSRTSIINLQHPGDESSVKERESEKERQAGGECNLKRKKEQAVSLLIKLMNQADDSLLVNVMAFVVIN